MASPLKERKGSSEMEGEESFFDALVAKTNEVVDGPSVNERKAKERPLPPNEEIVGFEPFLGSDPNSMDACFKTFDKDEDNSLNINEFTALLKALFRNEKGKPYNIDEHLCNEIFLIFNKSGDGSLSKEEFIFCWNNWIKKVVRPVSALLVVDVQNDFISGSLAIKNCPAKQEGGEVVPLINEITEVVPFDSYFYSLDWHPSDHISFVDNVHVRKLDAASPIVDPEKTKTYDTVIFEGPPRTEQILWPRHCVQDTWGAEIHKDLKVHPKAVMIHKGTTPHVDSYSAFFDNHKMGHTELDQLLRSCGVTDVYVCGIAFDVCVASTAYHAQELGYRTILVDDCSRGINVDAIEKVKEKIKEQNGVVAHSSELKPMVMGRDRRVELGYTLALECRKMIGIYPTKNRNSKFNPLPPGVNPSDNDNNGSAASDKPQESANPNHNAVKASA